MSAESTAPLSAEAAAALAAQHGLTRIDEPPTLFGYLGQAWHFRHFAFQYAVSRTLSLSARNRLGLLWEFITPLSNAMMYFLAFGLILGTRKDSPNFIFFLIAGVLTWQLFLQSFNMSAQSLVASRELLRSHRLPHLVMPVSAGLQALLRTLPLVLLIYPVALVTGEPVRWQWLLLPIQMVIVVLLGLSFGLISSRAVAKVRDLQLVLPMVTRLLMFTSGIFFSVEVRFANADIWIRRIAESQPVAVLLNMTRGLFIPEDLPTPHQMLGVATVIVVFSLAGAVSFWWSERRNG